MENVEKILFEVQREGEEKAQKILNIIAKEYETADVKYGEILVLTAFISAGLLAPLITDIKKKGNEQRIQLAMKAYFDFMKYYMKKFIE